MWAGMKLAQAAALLAFALLLCIPEEARTYFTYDAGVNVTVHANFNVGPPVATEKFDLLVHGDMVVGTAQKVEPSSPRTNVDVEGGISGHRFVFRPPHGLGLGPASSSTTARDIVFLQSRGLFDGAGALAGHNVSLVRTTDQGSFGLQEHATLSVETAIGSDTRAGDARLVLRGNGNGVLQIQADGAEGTVASQITLTNRYAGGAAATNFRLAHRQRALDVSSDVMDVVRVHDAWPTKTRAGALWNQLANGARGFARVPRLQVNVTDDGSSVVTVTAPHARLASSGFVDGMARAEVAIHQGDTELALTNEPRTTGDVVVFRNGTRQFLELTPTRLSLEPQEALGHVRVGRPAGVVSGTTEPLYHGGELTVGELATRFVNTDNSSFYATLEGQPRTRLAVSLVSGDGPSGTTRSVPYPVVLQSGTFTKQHAPMAYVGDGEIGVAPFRTAAPVGKDRWTGDWRGGAVGLNGTGLSQSAPDFPLILHTRQTSAGLTTGGGLAGVVLTGAYKLDVGGITLLDIDDGRVLPSDKRSTRRITSKGTLRLSAFDSTDNGLIPAYGSGANTSEVYVDGNERKGGARLRVGNAVFHDAYTAAAPFTLPVMDGVAVQSLTSLDAAALIAVGSASKDATGAPSTTDPLNPAVNPHSGLLVLRSPLEVRVDEASVLRVGQPNASVVVRGGASTVIASDNPSAQFSLESAFGVDVGGGQRSTIRERVPYGSSVAGLGKGGRPAVVVRDLEIDGCAPPKASAPNLGDAYTTTVYATAVTRNECVTRIGAVFPEAGATGGVADAMGKYTTGEHKEIYFTSRNYIDFDGRSRFKAGGLFFDGLGAQAGDFENAFSESNNYNGTFDPLKGDTKNTIRGDSGLTVSGGRQGGAVRITGGTSRVSGVAGGDVVVSSGGTGHIGTWTGDSGRIQLLTAGVATTGSSGEIRLATGGVTSGASGQVAVSTGDALNTGNSGSVSIATGASAAAASGGVNVAVGASGGLTSDGGAITMTAGTSAQANGGGVGISGGSSASTGKAGGSVTAARVLTVLGELSR
ncbi:unnamed protein product [Pedinophyceae sp. YPF-701]|nr:unnamed protein product [Pedinophyceae sp. YPF-701]